MSLPLNSPPPKEAAAAATSRPPPMDVINADRPPLGLPPAAIPSPRKSSVVCFGPNMEGVPIISSFKPEPPSQGRPSPSPAATEPLSGSTCRWGHCKFSCCVDGDVDDMIPNPRSKEAFVPAAPIWAAFCSNAVADMAGCGGGAYCLRSCPAFPNIEDPWLVERPREIGSIEEDGARSAGWSGRPMARIRSVNAGGWEGCKFADAVEEANKLANTLLLVLPLLLELVMLLELPFKPSSDGVSSKMRRGFSGNSATKVKIGGKGVKTKRVLLQHAGIESLKGPFYFYVKAFRRKRRRSNHNGFLSLNPLLSHPLLAFESLESLYTDYKTSIPNNYF